MSFGGGWDDEEVMSEINMTPLVDVMLVLLIVFMITVPVLTHTIPVALPRADAAPPTLTESPTLIISVTLDGALHWNDELINAEQLAQRLHSVAAQNPQPDVQLRGDRQVAYEKVMQVMAAAQQAGLQKLGFVTEIGSN
jgi:biopolymer transport protein ExbD